MRKINLTKQADKFLKRLPPKQRGQVARKLYQLAEDPHPPDSKQLKGFPFFRADVGEYRIVYRFDAAVLYVPAVGKRNDADVYRRLKRMG